tara:strand:+ start:1165 stop:1689 length:525 start_codon:yes stop_codon:yes gene_type:complete
MKKSELKQIIKEELLKEFKGGVLDYFYNQGYSAGQMLNPLVDELIKTKGLEGAKNHIGSLVGDEPQYDMSSRTPFREGISKVLKEDNYPSPAQKVAHILKAQNYYNDDFDLVAKLEQKFNTQINDKSESGNPTALPFIDSLIKRWRPQWYENEELGMNAFDLENFIAKTIRSYR